MQLHLHLPSNRDADAWQLAIWNLADDEVSRPQKLQLMLMLEASFNSFDAFAVVHDLLRLRDRWQGVLMQREDLIPLRDIGDDCWNVDTVYILTDKTSDRFWDELKERWSADEVDWIGGSAASLQLGASDTKGMKVLRVWWD